jgi:hypothetical protein
MTTGKIKLRSPRAHRARVMFSPDQRIDGHVDDILPGSVFDTKLGPGEVNVLVSKALLGGGRPSISPVHYCPECRTLVIPEIPGN